MWERPFQQTSMADLIEIRPTGPPQTRQRQPIEQPLNFKQAVRPDARRATQKIGRSLQNQQERNLHKARKSAFDDIGNSSSRVVLFERKNLAQIPREPSNNIGQLPQLQFTPSPFRRVKKTSKCLIIPGGGNKPMHLQDFDVPMVASILGPKLLREQHTSLKTATHHHPLANGTHKRESLCQSPQNATESPSLTQQQRNNRSSQRPVF